MSQFWPHTLYAEEQPLSHIILTTHVFTRAFTAGSVFGAITGSSIYLLRQFNVLSTSPSTRPISFTRMLLRPSATGASITMALMVPGISARMWGRDGIEWKDRSWRLLENKGQTECDDWTYAGMIAGAIAGSNSKIGGGGFGGAGLGSVVGIIGYIAWRYGVNGGVFKESES